jgi:peptidoglycan/LPS O-acetylase OafA/YrhL
MLAWAVIGIGALLVLISLLVGKSPGFGWRQTLGVVVGALVVLAGIYLRHRGDVSP